MTSNFNESSSESLFSPFIGARQKSRSSQDFSKTANVLSGLFTSHLSTAGQGSITAFVHLPDGSTSILGNISLSGNTSSSIPYGPFNQLGTYSFGIRVDEGTVLPAQTRAGSIEIDVNGSTMQKYDVILPANPPAHYEPNPFTYQLF